MHQQCSHSVIWNGWRSSYWNLLAERNQDNPKISWNLSLLGLLPNLWICLARMFCTTLMSCVAFDHGESAVEVFGKKQKADTDARPLVNRACRATCSSNHNHNLLLHNHKFLLLYVCVMYLLPGAEKSRRVSQLLHRSKRQKPRRNGKNHVIIACTYGFPRYVNVNVNHQSYTKSNINIPKFHYIFK